MSLSDVIESLVEERGLEESVLRSIVCDGMLAAYKKKYPELNLRVGFSKKDKNLVVEIEKTVVLSVSNEEIEISQRKAKSIDDSIPLGGLIWISFDGTVGRVEILRTKQLIATRIKEVEFSAVFNEFSDKQGTVVQGIVHKVERNGVIIKINGCMAFLPGSLGVPNEKLVVGNHVRALLKEVLLVPKGENQLILDRASFDFVAKLFALEIPEVFEKIVEIKKIVRNAGYKTKVAVSSRDKNVDPVGTCVGVGGVRIKPILKEIGIEKIDIIEYSDSLESFIADSLKPAEINRVELSDDNSCARIWLDGDQRSLAIGKLGQNISLASRLTGVNIELSQPSGDESF